MPDSSDVFDTVLALLTIFTDRALDKRVFDDIFSYFSSKPYVVTPHLNRLIETVQMRGHNICFYAELTKRYP